MIDRPCDQGFSFAPYRRKSDKIRYAAWMGRDTFEAMPELGVLRLHASDGQVMVTFGRALLYRYDASDTGMRNLAVVALTDAGRRVDEVAAVFGLSATYVSILRGRAARNGSAALVRRRGRPPKLSERQVTRARTWAGHGLSQQAIADRLGVARSVISELLARKGPLPVQQELPEPAATEPDTTTEAEPIMAQPVDTEPLAILCYANSDVDLEFQAAVPSRAVSMLVRTCWSMVARARVICGGAGGRSAASMGRRSLSWTLT
jgi:transposase